MHTHSSRLVDELVRLVTAAVRGSRRAEIEAMDRQSLSLSQFKILSALECTPNGLGPSELAGRIDLSPGATSRAADAMVQDGLLERREDAHDRRVRTLHLTDAGRQIAGPLWAARQDAIGGLVELITPAESDALSAALQPLLTKIGDNL